MKVIIIDDEARSRKSIANLLKLSPVETELVAEAENIKSGLESIQKHKPELILLDINRTPLGATLDIT